MYNLSAQQKQQGVSLIIALVVLLIITLIGISAVRLSSQDLLIASNEEQQVLVYQEAKSVHQKTANFYHLLQWLKQRDSLDSLDLSIKHQKIHSSITINAGNQYLCFGQQGEAMSLGPGAIRCRAYHFTINSRLTGTGAHARLVKGMGKELPSLNKGSMK